MMRTRFYIQKLTDGEWSDHRSSKKGFSNFIVAEDEVIRLMLKEKGLFRIVSRRSEEHIVKEYNETNI